MAEPTPRSLLRAPYPNAQHSHNEPATGARRSTAEHGGARTEPRSWGTVARVAGRGNRHSDMNS